MTDTPQHVKALQLKIWLSKSPMERLFQMMTDNEALMKFWSTTHRTDNKVPRSEPNTEVL
jgi:uncharacterized protein YndB with AHSA1/START domain